MEAVDVMSDGFWSEAGPAVLAPPALAAAGRRLAERLDGESWARDGVVFASSGSSGEPKWIIHHREGLLCSAEAVNRHLGVGRNDCWFLALPDFHVGGFGVGARARAAGCRYGKLSGRWDAARFVAALAEDGGTHTSLVPTQVHDLVAAGLRCPDRVRAVVVGGGALDNDLGRKARELGWPLLQSYGLTEAGSQVATAGLPSLGEEFRNSPLPVMSHWEARTGTGGVLELKGPALFSGYVRMDGGEVRREEAGVDGWFRTTDRVALDGDALQFLGRTDRVVKVLGELVDLVDLERRLRDAVGVAHDCRVVALPDGRTGRLLVPVFEGRVPAEVRALIARVNSSLPGFSRLAKPVELDVWPRTPLGKVDLPALEERVAAM